MGDHSPLMFESDDEDDVETEESRSINNDEKDIVQEETPAKKKVVQLRGVLAGVPPPPTLTFLQMDARHLLELWNQNKQQFTLQDVSGRGTDQLEKDLSKKPWIESISDNYYGVYYNRSRECEQVEALSLKYQERFVGSETSSSVNALSSRSPPKTASARKRARRLAHGGHSPGRRLSHLARRRHTFSSIDLRQTAPSNNKKMILVNNKLKTNPRKRLKNSATKNPAANTSVSGGTASASIPKRALFQSPENGKKQSKTPVQSTQRTRRALFSKDNSTMPVLSRQDAIETGVKRQRESDSLLQKNADIKKRCTRSLLFEENEERITSPPLLTAQTLSKLHKQKLLWAVSGALREEGIKIKDTLFQPCASLLFNHCKSIWLKESAIKSKQITSTSDKMLEIVKRYCPDTVAKVSAKLKKTCKPAELTKPLQVLPQNVLDNNSSLKTETDISKKGCADDVSLSIGFKNCDNVNDSDTKTCATVNAS